MTKTAKRPRAWWHYFLPPVLATLTIVAVFDVYHPFAPVGDDLLQVGGFEGASFDAQPRLTKWRGWGARARWDASAGWKGSAGLVLESEGRHHGSIAVEIEDPGRFQALTFSGRIRSEGARAGTEDWLRPRYVLYFRDGDDKPRWDYPHGVCFVRETQDWTFCRESFVVPAFAKKAVVVGQNAGTAGRVFLDDMELRPAERRASATWVLVVTALIWTLGFGVPIAWSRLWTRRFGLTTLLVALAIVAGVTAPANVMTEILRGIDDGASVVRSFWRSSPRAAGDLAPASPSNEPRPATPAPPPAPAQRPITAEGAGDKASASAGSSAVPSSAGRSEESGRSSGSAPRPSVPVGSPPSSEAATPAASATPAAPSRPLVETSAPDPEQPSRLQRSKKLGHAVLFAALGVLAFACARFALPRVPLLFAVLAIAIFAVGTEAAQFLVWKRQPTLIDVGIDLAGAATGMLACGFGLALWRLIRGAGPTDPSPPKESGGAVGSAPVGWAERAGRREGE